MTLAKDNANVFQWLYQLIKVGLVWGFAIEGLIFDQINFDFDRKKRHSFVRMDFPNRPPVAVEYSIS